MIVCCLLTHLTPDLTTANVKGGIEILQLFFFLTGWSNYLVCKPLFNGASTENNTNNTQNTKEIQ